MTASQELSLQEGQQKAGSVLERLDRPKRRPDLTLSTPVMQSTFADCQLAGSSKQKWTGWRLNLAASPQSHAWSLPASCPA
ncbi:rCG62501, isoform CRA_b [Rattus norvegicus]|uniref:RCG62501, isoform CRA_b n=1 Tax=Rattus norvegicus TaxID=10116 RepID=A6J657_RAT|nr:rCG62501, isoform CRA_b [Rattus norvegicus]